MEEWQEARGSRNKRRRNRARELQGGSVTMTWQDLQRLVAGEAWLPKGKGKGKGKSKGGAAPLANQNGVAGKQPTGSGKGKGKGKGKGEASSQNPPPGQGKKNKEERPGRVPLFSCLARERTRPLERFPQCNTRGRTTEEEKYNGTRKGKTMPQNGTNLF